MKLECFQKIESSNIALACKWPVFEQGGHQVALSEEYELGFNKGFSYAESIVFDWNAFIFFHCLGVVLLFAAVCIECGYLSF